VLEFSVLISVYIKEKPENIRLAFQSLVDQSLPAKEVILVKDGPLGDDLNKVIALFEEQLPLKYVVLEKNMSLGYALNVGLEHCQYEWVARMDTDDICHGDRFKIQAEFICNHPEYDLVGTNIIEFIEKPGDLNRQKKVPEKHKDIVRFAYSRCPFNHPSIFFRKSAVLAVGSYQAMVLFEDYYLWFRLIKAGFKFYNIQQPLLFFRLGKDMLGRRQGLEYGVNESKFFIQAYQEILIPFSALMKFLMRFPVRILPRSFTLFLYNSFLRK
jgi:glycosyltransferase involved in cell wall biosynthesis